MKGKRGSKNIESVVICKMAKETEREKGGKEKRGKREPRIPEIAKNITTIEGRVAQCAPEVSIYNSFTVFTNCASSKGFLLKVV